MDTQYTKTWIQLFAAILATALIPQAGADQDMKMAMPETAPKKHSMSMNMHGMYGAYPMRRDSSGTSWQPDATPAIGIQSMQRDWMLMADGYITGIHNHQGGTRGATQNYSTSMFMLMAQKDIGKGTLGLRGMLSLDPQMGAQGYPLLFQAGETANGKTTLIDRQHPHDFFMELAASYSLLLSKDSSLFAYIGLPGEPALGPPVFMHRWSGMDIPEVPLTHHWLDSTHVSFGVTTLGWIWKNLKIEGSLFRGREPDKHRWNMESPKLDSNALRLSYNPTENWALQMSYGHIKSPEQLSPDVNTNRSTASVVFNQPLTGDDHWQTTFAWGQNANHPGHRLNGFLLESTRTLGPHHEFYGRVERLQEDELLSESPTFSEKKLTMNKLSLGYSYLFHLAGVIQPEFGGLMSTYDLPVELRQVYGQRPFSYLVFTRIRLGH